MTDMEHMQDEKILQGENLLAQFDNVLNRSPKSVTGKSSSSKAKVQGEEFEATEHENIGNKVKLQFLLPSPNGNTKEVLRGQRCLQLPNNLMLTFGQIIALAGDFYGVPEQPIVDVDETNENEAGNNRRKRFIAAYNNTLARTDYEIIKKELDEILRIMTKEKSAIQDALGEEETVAVADQDGKHVRIVPSDVYEKLGNSLVEEWDAITGGKWVLGIPVIFGRIMKLAENNHDHFLPYAKDAYLAGHELALDKAREASCAKDHETKRRLLDEAYSMDAFACHFLTDSFSSGHARVPRLELGKQVTPAALGHFLCKCMHDEDNKYGLRVRNQKGDTWTSFGDGMLLNKQSEGNKKIAVKAVQKSVDQVYNAFTDPNKPIDSSQVTRYIPYVDPDAKNNYPLFQVKDGKVLRRADLTNLTDTNTKSDWSAVKTAWTLRSYEPEQSAIEEFDEFAVVDCRSCGQSLSPSILEEAEHQ